MKTCSITDCGKPARTMGWCDKHYMRYHKHGNPLTTLVIRSLPGTTCAVAGCGRKIVAKKLCSAHWQRLHFHGDVAPEIRVTKGRPGCSNNNWKGGEIDDGTGRVLIYSPGHPHPTKSGTHVYRYRLVMEKHLGRFLSPEEIVHHKNHDKTDDRLDNLELMSQSEHARLHNQNGRFV